MHSSFGKVKEKMAGFAKRTTALVMVATLVGGCVKSSTGKVSSEDNLVPINVAQDLFPNNSLPEELRSELKSQFFASVGWIRKIMRERTGNTDELTLKEIVVSKGDKTLLEVCVSAAGSVKAKDEPVTNNYNYSSRTGSGCSNPSDVQPGSLGGSFATTYLMEKQSYKIQYVFEDKKGFKATGSDANTGEVYRFDLKDPLEVEEKLKIESRVKISLNAIKALPAGLRNIVAQFFDSISAELETTSSFTRESKIATRMFYRGKDKSSPTELERQLFTDIVLPLCVRVTEVRKLDPKSCVIDIPAVAQPLEELQKEELRRMQSKVFSIRNCENTELKRDNRPVHYLYVAVPAERLVFPDNTEVALYERRQGGWQRIKEGFFRRDWLATVKGDADGTKCGEIGGNELCKRSEFVREDFTSKCEAIANKTTGTPTLGISAKTSDDIEN